MHGRWCGRRCNAGSVVVGGVVLVGGVVGVSV